MKNLLFILFGCALLWACSQPKPEPEAVVETKPKPFEIGDAKYVEIGKQTLTSLSTGDVDGFLSNLSDDAKFFWNYGDSLIGKQAISDYWKDRRGKVIDTLSYAGDIWLAIDANDPPAPNLEAGPWVFAWFSATAKYKATGKSMTQYIHQVHHFDTNGKIDYISQFLDRVPIQQAIKK